MGLNRRRIRMGLLNAFAFVLKEPAARIKAALYATGLFLFLGIPTALLSNPIIPYLRMIPATPLDYAFLLTTSLLGGVYLALPQKKECRQDKKALGGGLLGFLAFSCPTCSMLLVFLLGFDFMFNVVNPLRPILGVLSIIVLAYAIGKKWQEAKLQLK